MAEEVQVPGMYRLRRLIPILHNQYQTCQLPGTFWIQILCLLMKLEGRGNLEAADRGDDVKKVQVETPARHGWVLGPRTVNGPAPLEGMLTERGHGNTG